MVHNNLAACYKPGPPIIGGLLIHFSIFSSTLRSLKPLPVAPCRWVLLAALAQHPDGAKQADYSAGQQAARIWWGMCCTGMGPSEFWGEWSVREDRVRIVGTKRPGRRWGSEGRDVPLLTRVMPPEMTSN